MPILEFKTTNELKDWASALTIPDRYVIFATADKEVIVHPIKTSKPIVYGYVQAASQEAVDDAVKHFEANQYKVFKIKSYTWADDKQPIFA